MIQNPKCKITILKRLLNQDIIDDYLKEGMKSGLCSTFKEGDEFFVNSEFDIPENFCPWAWADIRNDILAITHGAQFPWFKEKGMTIAGCTDWFKPVLFKIEKL